MNVYVTGETEHQLDDKGRVNVPKKAHVLFSQHGGFLTRAFNGKSLIFYPTPVWTKLQERLADFDVFDVEADKIARYLSCGLEVDLDNQGRLTIPAALRHHAKIEKDVTLIAMGSKMEIWDTQTWRDYNDASFTEDGLGQALSAVNLRRAVAG